MTYKKGTVTIHEIVSKKDCAIFELEKIRKRVEDITIEHEVPRVFMQCFNDKIDDIIEKIPVYSKK